MTNVISIIMVLKITIFTTENIILNVIIIYKIPCMYFGNQYQKWGLKYV